MYREKSTLYQKKSHFSGKIGIGGTGSLQLSASMRGIWEKAFGIKYLAFGNIAVSIGIIPGVAVTEFGNSIVKVDFIFDRFG